MSEVINIHLGGCGVTLGSEFWRDLYDQHCLNGGGKYMGSEPDFEIALINSFYDLTSKNRYVPRAILADLDSSFDAGQFGGLFNPKNVITEGQTATSIWAKGYYGEGEELTHCLLKMIRIEAEKCDSLQGFLINHCIGGGTGSGVGCSILEKIHDLYPDRLTSTFTVLPSSKLSDIITEPYNVILSLNYLMEFSEMSFCLDNESYYNALARDLSDVSEDDLTEPFAQIMSTITGSLRTPGNSISNLRKLAQTVAPFPTLHFTMPVTHPMDPLELDKRLEPKLIVNNLFSGKNLLNAYQSNADRVLASVAMFQGITHTNKETTLECVNALKKKNTSKAVKNVQISFSNLPKLENKPSGCLVVNSTGMASIFSRVMKQFQSLYSKKAYIHLYCQEGMKREEMSRAAENMEDLLAAYRYRKNTLKDDVCAMANAKYGKQIFKHFNA